MGQYTCWILEILNASSSPSVVPFRGIEHPVVLGYSYTVEVDGAAGENGRITGELTISSPTPLSLRAGQTITINVETIDKP